MKGIDVSSYQGTIDWSKVKSEIDFAIIRCGYGDNIKSQDDKEFFNNVNGCIENKIPYAIYLYSYAKKLSGSESIESEVEHCKRLLDEVPTKPFCVYIDMEDDSIISLGKDTLTNHAIYFCNKIESLGYQAGVYANENWFKNYLNASLIAKDSYSIWCAKYSQTRPNISVDYDIWQYSSTSRVNGINGNVDMNEMYNDIRNNGQQSTQRNNITYQIWDDVKNKWLPNVVNDSDYAGLYGHDVCCVYANLDIGDVYYKVHYKSGKWLPEVKNREDYAGLYNKPIDGFMIKSNTKKLTYRVHLRRQNRWLPWVTGYNTSDFNNGYAGIIGQEIDGIQIK